MVTDFMKSVWIPVQSSVVPMNVSENSLDLAVLSPVKARAPSLTRPELPLSDPKMIVTVSLPRDSLKLIEINIMPSPGLKEKQKK